MLFSTYVNLINKILSKKIISLKVLYIFAKNIQ